MKCPKCGFTSFDHLTNCKKCGIDLGEHRQRFGLMGLIFGAKPAHRPLSDEPAPAPVRVTSPSPAADSGFDFLTEPEPGESPLDDLLAATVTDSSAETAAGFDPQESVFADPEASPFTEESPTAVHPAGDEPAGPAARLEEAADTDQFLDLDLDLDHDLAYDETAAVAAAAEDFELSDFPGQDELPALEEEPGFFFDDSQLPPLEEISLEAVTTGEFSFDGTPAENDSDRQTEENPADPFDLRESAVAGQTPVTDRANLRATALAIDAAEAAGAEAVAEDSGPPHLPRCLAGLTDFVIIGIIFVCFVAAAELAIGATRPLAANLIDLLVPYFLVLFFVCFGYFTLFHFLVGQTLGKMLFRLRVIGLDQEALLFSQAFLRSSGGLLSLLTAGAGFVPIFFDRRARGWSDRLAGTRVVALDSGAALWPAAAQESPAD